MKMVNRMILIDGVEASGKTHLINKLKSAKKPNWKFIKCPSDSLINNHYYDMTSNDTRNLSIFVDSLIQEIREEFINSPKDTTFIFDRGMLSTLVYQGKNPDIIRIIWEKYLRLYSDLKIDLENSCIILMDEQVDGKIREEKIECKRNIGKGMDVKARFNQFAGNFKQPIPFYKFSYNKQKPSWIELNDLASEVIELA